MSGRTSGVATRRTEEYDVGRGLDVHRPRHVEAAGEAWVIVRVVTAIRCRRSRVRLIIRL